MSYSFGITAANKKAAKKAVSVELVKIIANQPGHAADLNHVNTLAHAFIDALDVPEGRGINCTGYGALGQNYTADATGMPMLSNIAVNLNVSIT